MPSGCGAVAGVLAEDETCIASTARNFRGRMGAASSRVFLGSPYTVAASAVRGSIADPRELLAEGIYEAMVTTAAGLIVAIPALICYHWISAKIERLVAEMDRQCIRFIEDTLIVPDAAAPARNPSPQPANGQAAPAQQTERKPEAEPAVGASA